MNVTSNARPSPLSCPTGTLNVLAPSPPPPQDAAGARVAARNVANPNRRILNARR